ncbi:hypothetical protein TNCV_1512341 [Trichonephila clavipes]|nr:hypothetical protein TNCV_1512341 [Trichonephila clavipes]
MNEVLYDAASVKNLTEEERQERIQRKQGLGSNPGQGKDVCKCIVPLRHGGTLNSRQAPSSFVRVVEERWEASDHPLGVLPLN